MVFLIAAGEVKGKVMLVRAENREEVEERLKLKEGESILGALTSNEVETLHTSCFTVITA